MPLWGLRNPFGVQKLQSDAKLVERAFFSSVLRLAGHFFRMKPFAALLDEIMFKESNIPGASLGLRHDGKPHESYELAVPELERWLACRGASTARRTGCKPDLVERYVMGKHDVEVFKFVSLGDNQVNLSS